ncbi:MAG: lysophospholipid acyltransferase family protein [Acidiferrobacterales bacterium]
MSSAQRTIDNKKLAEDYRPRFSFRFFSTRFWPTWLVLAVVGLCVLLPRPISAFIGARLGDLYRSTSKKRRNIVDVNLRLCFPEMSAEARAQLSRSHFRIYGQTLLDMGLIWWARRKYLDRYLKVEGLEHYRTALDNGRNVILLTGHFSAADIAAPAISRHHPQAGLIKPINNALLDYMVAHGRLRWYGKSYLRDKGMRPVVKAIKAGYGFYYLPDEDLGPQKSIFVPFLATESATITALSKLARITNAVVLPTSARRISAKQGYHVVIHSALDDFPSDDAVADTRRMNAELAKLVADAPEQYMWTFKFFRTRPGGEASPYD